LSVLRDTKYKEPILAWEGRAPQAANKGETSALLPVYLCNRPTSLAQARIDNWHFVYQNPRVIHPKEVAMQVGDILRKKAARVATVRMNETVAIAAQLMRSSNISALVVKDVVRTEGNTAVGMFTERDVVRAIAEHGANGANLKVSQLISVQQLVSCQSTDTLEQVRHVMNREHIRHLPVIDNYSLIGVISMRDISTAFDDEATGAKPAAGDVKPAASAAGTISH
jgi:CBS domain-containing protein